MSVEIPVLVVVFGVPAAIAWFIGYKLGATKASDRPRRRPAALTSLCARP